MGVQKKAYKGAIDHPVKAHNIIIYAGDDHCLRYRKFLKSIGFDVYVRSGDFGITKTTCLDISKFKTPFFSELPPDKSKMTEREREEIKEREYNEMISRLKFDELNKTKDIEIKKNRYYISIVPFFNEKIIDHKIVQY